MKKKILIVEDEYFLAMTIKDRFEFLGYDVAIAENGEEALHFLELNLVDLVIMDIIMPVMDGLEATRKIRAKDKWKKIPVIILTARARPEDQQASIDAGANDYLAKPFQAEALTAMVQKWISK